ncbi:MAG: TonB-dependent receptor [bacterium]|nr:MAG: TonB-dependent receptor [bacterium]
MKTFISIIILLLNLITFNALSQTDKGTITGIIIDSRTRDPLVGVNVIVIGNNKGTAANLQGRFWLDLAEGEYFLKFSMIGYKVFELKNVRIQASKTMHLRIHLVQKAIELQAVTVSGERPLVNKQPEVSSQILQRRELTKVSGAFEDVTRTVQTLPGVVSQADFSGRMYVRGGRADENIVLLDRTFIYEPYHLGGMVSIFNPDLIDRAEFYAGGFPASHGNAMSSFLMVTNQKGNKDNFEGKFSLSFLSTNAYVGAPFLHRRGSWFLSARRTYHDQLMKAIGAFENYIFPNFYDLQMILFYPLGENNLLSFSGLHTGDRMKLQFEKSTRADTPADSGDFDWNNQMTIGTFDWKWIISPKIFTHTTFSYSEQPFKYRTFGLYPQWIEFCAKNYDFREDATLLNFNNHKMETGIYLHRSDVVQKMFFNKSYWMFFAGENKNTSVRISDDSARVSMDNEKSYNYAGAYIQDQWELLPPLLSINAGLRWEYFDVSQQMVWSPRLSCSFVIDKKTVFKGAWGYYRQFPKDPVQMDADNGNPHLKAQHATHYILGIERQIAENVLTRIEWYYKDFRKLIVKNPVTNFSNTGTGESYGGEIFLQKRVSGKLDGWVSYSYSVSKRKDEPQGVEYYPMQDQRHTVSAVVNYHPHPNWDISLKWLIYSGRPYTPLDSVIYFPETNSYLPIEGLTNSKRLPSYQRLDVRVDYWFKWGKVPFSIYFEVLNLYNHKNIYDYIWNEDYSQRSESYQFPLLPTFGVSMRF